MKFTTTASLLTLLLLSKGSIAQSLYKNESLLLATNERAEVSIGKTPFQSRWRISPQVSHDTLKAQLYSKQEEFAFRTDKDSIRFNLKAGETKSFYVKLGNAEPAYTLITGVAYKWDKIAYGNDAKRKDLKMYYQDPKNPYFDSLRRQYPLGEIIKKDRTDQEKVLSILNWTHHQWKHDGNNAPKGEDGISILNEAKAGGRFPCFAYSIVLRDQLIAYGYTARVLYIKTKDAETRKGSPGHVVTEVYLNDQKKWVFVDGQFNVMPTLKGKPLNGAQFQNALSNHYDDVVLASRDQISKRDYTDFVYDYLYYFDTALDNRPVAADKKFTLEGKRSLMLVPVGAPNLTKISFWNSTVNYCLYTNSLKDFYAQPVKNQL